MNLSIIVAMSLNRVIGMENKIPWHLPEDLKHFKETTMGSPVIMGRKTFDSIIKVLGKPLPGRTNIVISRNSEFSHPNIKIAKTPNDSIKIAEMLNVEETFVIGGMEIYDNMMPYVNRLVVTEIKEIFHGDAYFPELDFNYWSEVNRKSLSGTLNYDIIEYRRKNGHITPS